MLRKLFIGLIACIVLSIGIAFIVPKLGLYVPWYVPLAAFGAIAFGVLATGDLKKEVKEGQLPEAPETYDTDEGGPKMESHEPRDH